MSGEMDIVNSPSNKVGERLREEVQRVGGVSKALEVIKATRSTLYNWFESGLIPATELQNLAGIGVEPDYVITGSRPLFFPGATVTDKAGQAALLRKAAQSLYPGDGDGGSEQGWKIRVDVQGQKYFVDPAEYRFVPFFDVTIGAGGGRVVNFLAEPRKFNAYRADYLAERGLLEAHLFEAKTNGDSMHPEIRNGEIILVNASDKVIRSGDIYVVQIGDEFICKYLRRLPGELIEVSSKNFEVHPAFTIKEGLLGNGVEIIGSVVRQGRDR